MIDISKAKIILLYKLVFDRKEGREKETTFCRQKVIRKFLLILSVTHHSQFQFKWVSCRAIPFWRPTY